MKLAGESPAPWGNLQAQLSGGAINPRGQNALARKTWSKSPSSRPIMDLKVNMDMGRDIHQAGPSDLHISFWPKEDCVTVTSSLE